MSATSLSVRDVECADVECADVECIGDLLRCKDTTPQRSSAGFGKALLFGVLCLGLGGCISTVASLGMKLIFEPTPWPESLVVRDLAYVQDPPSTVVQPDGLGAPRAPEKSVEEGSGPVEGSRPGTTSGATEPGEETGSDPAGGDDDSAEERLIGKHQLDLFLPASSAVLTQDRKLLPEAGSASRAKDFPTLIFVHGGGWNSGDKGLEVGGVDVYGNIGSFYASKGYGVAVINYRLQPAVTWRDQVMDVARAMAWLGAHIEDYGGDPDRMFLSGHSAGAQLATYVALSPWPLDEVSFDRSSLCGVVAISGAGYDLGDAKTYDMGADPAYYEKRFRIAGESGDWREEGSALRHLSPKSPPFLVAFAEEEWKSLHRQARLLHEGLRTEGVSSRLVKVPDVGHRRIVLGMSQPKGPLDDAVSAFLARNSASCSG